jgi:hypothetical protein
MQKTVYIVAYEADDGPIGVYQHTATEYKNGRVNLGDNTWLKECNVHDTWSTARKQALLILERRCDIARDRLFHLQSEFERIDRMEDPTV